ncbi:MAG: HD domain-containing protein, partial [Promethearchaeota archaeon]
SRFEHSIGVMHLGQLVYKRLIQQEASLNSEQLKNTVRYACLLHDIGHAPFSHALEVLFEEEECKTKLMTHDLSFTDDSIASAPHELMSCAIALENFGEKFDELNIDKDLFCRMILGIDYEQTNSNSNKNPLIHLLNSHIDVDKLDYLMRDSMMTDVRGLISIDKERVIFSYKVHDKKLLPSSKALSVISNLVYGRNAMYMWVYNHQVVAYYTSLIHRYMKHLIDLKPELKSKYFSFDSINSQLIDDYDIINLFKSKREKDNRTKSFYKQIFDRKYLKPIWKTRFELQQKINNSMQRDKILLRAKSNLEDEIIATLSLNQDDLYVILAKINLFNPMDTEDIYIYIDDNNIPRFTELFEKSIHSIPVSEIPYIFTKEKLKVKVLEYLKSF